MLVLLLACICLAAARYKEGFEPSAQVLLVAGLTPWGTTVGLGLDLSGVSHLVGSIAFAKSLPATAGLAQQLKFAEQKLDDTCLTHLVLIVFDTKIQVPRRK